VVKVTLKDGSVREYKRGTTLGQVAADISGRLGKEALVASVDGKAVDLGTTLENDASVAFFTFEDEEGRQAFRHSTSHVLAQAVQKLFPGTRLAIGPAIAEGFYYDFDSPVKFTPEILEKIQSEMESIIKADLPFKRQEMTREESLDFFEKAGENYKVELINDLPVEASISCYGLRRTSCSLHRTAEVGEAYQSGRGLLAGQ